MCFFKKPLNKSRVATTVAWRDGMQERRRRKGSLPFARSLTPQTARQGAPDSVSRSVVREGTQAAARNTVKWGTHAAVPAPQASLTVSRQPSREGCGGIGRSLCRAPRLRSAPRTRSRAAWCGQGRRRLRSIAWSGACAAAPASGPWANGSQPRYDLRRAARDHPNSASNAAHEGLIQRFLSTAGGFCIELLAGKMLTLFVSHLNRFQYP